MDVLYWSDGEPQQVLIASARQMIEAGHHAAALITAQTAAEIVFERVIAGAIRRRAIRVLDEPLTAHFRGVYNPQSDRVRKLYVALTGDTVLVHQPWWPRYVELAKLRHKAVHEGAEVLQQDAIEMIECSVTLMRRAYSMLDRVEPFGR